MKSKYLIISIALLSLFLTSIDIVNAEVVYSESFLFSGGGSASGTPNDGAGALTDAETTCAGCIFDGTVDFTTYKQYSFFRVNNIVSRYGSGETQTLTLGVPLNGINNKYTPVIIYVNSILYGSGSIGWERTSGTNFNWVIYIDSIETGYANTLTGSQTMTFTYNTSVYSGISNGASSTGHVPGTLELFYFRVGVSASNVVGTYTPSSTNNYIEFDISDEVSASFNNVSSISGYYNLTKNNANMRVILENITGSDFYDVTSTDNISEFEIIDHGLVANIYHVALQEWVNRTIFYEGGLLTLPTTISGNLTIDKTTYNLTENVNLTWSLSNTDGRIRILDSSGFQTTYNKFEGNGFMYYYLDSNKPIGSYYAYLEYWDSDNSRWSILDYKGFYVIPENGLSFVQFQEDTYLLSDDINYIYYINQSSGYINILDSGSNLKLNNSALTTNTSQLNFFKLPQNSLTGTYTINLYDSSANLLSSDTAYINFAIVNQTTATATATTAPATSLIDITDELSQITFGQITDENGEMTDITIKRTGNKIYSSLLLFVVLILVISVWGKWKRMR